MIFYLYWLLCSPITSLILQNYFVMVYFAHRHYFFNASPALFDASYVQTGYSPPPHLSWELAPSTCRRNTEIFRSKYCLSLRNGDIFSILSILQYYRSILLQWQSSTDGLGLYTFCQTFHRLEHPANWKSHYFEFPTSSNIPPLPNFYRFEPKTFCQTSHRFEHSANWKSHYFESPTSSKIPPLPNFCRFEPMIFRHFVRPHTDPRFEHPSILNRPGTPTSNLVLFLCTCFESAISYCFKPPTNNITSSFLF